MLQRSFIGIGVRLLLQSILVLLLASPQYAFPTEGNWLPKGHYLSFDQPRNLQTEMVDLIENPDAANDYWLNLARRLDEALESPGVTGVWMGFPWRSVEVADGKYDWSVIDANMDVLADYGLKLIVKISDRSFNGTDVMPEYFPDQYVLSTTGGGHQGYTSKRWDPYVYNRLIRLYRAIAERYASHRAFGGIATTESATGQFEGGDSAVGYTIDKYVTALDEIVTRTQPYLTRGRLFLYLNFLWRGDRSDMNDDARVRLVQSVPHQNLVIGGPDITPDVRGMPRSVTAYRLHVRRNLPQVQQFCHLQHVDQGLNGINVKSNEHRKAYLDEIDEARRHEQQSWFNGESAVFELDDLRDPNGRKVDLHPESVLGDLWTPLELFEYGRRNFDCQYFIWHYREFPAAGEFTWFDVREVIRNNPCFHDPEICKVTENPHPPNLR